MWRIPVLFVLVLAGSWALIARPWQSNPRSGATSAAPSSAPSPEASAGSVPVDGEDSLLPSNVTVLRPMRRGSESSDASAQAAGGVGVFVHRAGELRVVLQLKEDGTFFMQSDLAGGGQRSATGTWVQQGARVGLTYVKVDGQVLLEVPEPEWSEVSQAGVTMRGAADAAPVLLGRQERVTLR